ncbi:hypothetical protein GFS31_21840 [Leptolyngbya sp. BL0902]|uniref:AAA family ATPase n=1 Tax=Leptolyngbya sp. BL0902 TaxID=1115757 RepID=UPI0019352456|nr:AAA family ATPase [Leptolyngbya sp. BL0902]QQE65496.1 hypothetical protein GFS31_21840 [Leptolyngbya sp. BL0902]
MPPATDDILAHVAEGSAPLLVLVGLPGSGKSTWSAQFLSVRPGFRVVSTDDCRQRLYGDAALQGDWRRVWACVQTEWQQGLEAITQGHLAGILYDATNARRRHRRSALVAARQMGFNPLVLVWIDVPLSVALARNRQRSRQVPDDVIAAMHRSLQGAPPALADGADQVIHIPIPSLEGQA